MDDIMIMKSHDAVFCFMVDINAMIISSVNNNKNYLSTRKLGQDELKKSSFL